MTWRLAHSLAVLRGEVDLRWPGRSKISDGTIGDAAHASRDSDHNPWVLDSAHVGVVRAIDITADGIEADTYAEHLRLLGEGGDRRLDDGGYVIWNRRIASATSGWQWRSYSGSNPHTSHIHLSVSRTPDGYDSDRSWGIGSTTGDDDMTDEQEAKLNATHLLATATADKVAELHELLEPLLRDKGEVPYARLQHIIEKGAKAALGKPEG